MTSEKLYEILGNIDENLVKEAEDRPRAPSYIRHPKRQKWYAAVACLCIAACIILPIMIHNLSSPHSSVQPGTSQATPPSTVTPQPNTPSPTPPAPNTPGAERPYTMIDGKKYYTSGNDPLTMELPDGFTAAGEFVRQMFNGSYYYNETYYYYTNPDIPEWVYIKRASLNSYSRLVDSRLSGKDLICYNGEYYISMWNVNYFYDDRDVTREYHDEMYSRYGIRIEGDLPDGFVLAGEAVYSGSDTVPTGTLASNEKEGKVYYSPNDPNVLLMETKWTVSPSTGKMNREGFDVYIRYDCPFAR